MKEFKSTHYLRISNRGIAINVLVENHSFSVNLPTCLRSLGPCKITVQDAMVNFANVNQLTDTMEVFATRNIPINASIDTETYATDHFDGVSYNKENERMLIILLCSGLLPLHAGSPFQQHPVDFTLLADIEPLPPPSVTIHHWRAVEALLRKVRGWLSEWQRVAESVAERVAESG